MRKRQEEKEKNVEKDSLINKNAELWEGMH